jgi:hypothetical protein
MEQATSPVGITKSIRRNTQGAREAFISRLRYSPMFNVMQEHMCAECGGVFYVKHSAGAHISKCPFVHNRKPRAKALESELADGCEVDNARLR